MKVNDVCVAQHIHRSLSLTALIATIISPKGETDHASYLISRQVVSLVQDIANLHDKVIAEGNLYTVESLQKESK